MAERLFIDTCAIIHLMYINRFDLLKLLDYCPITTIYVDLEFEKGHSQSFNYYKKLLNDNRISLFPLEIEDLVEMSKIPQSKRASDAELSCFIVAKRINAKVMTDDKKAINFIKNKILMPTDSIITLIDILCKAYSRSYLGDDDLRKIQQILKDNKFCIKENLVAEAARRRLMS